MKCRNFHNDTFEDVAVTSHVLGSSTSVIRMAWHRDIVMARCTLRHARIERRTDTRHANAQRVHRNAEPLGELAAAGGLHRVPSAALLRSHGNAARSKGRVRLKPDTPGGWKRTRSEAAAGRARERRPTEVVRWNSFPCFARRLQASVRGMATIRLGTNVAAGADMLGHRQLVPLLVAASTIATLSAANNPKEEFAASWEGETVVLKQRLHTLAYRERGLLGNGSNKRDGLFVVTPFNGTYYQFDGRQKKDDVRGSDPRRVVEAVTAAYAGDALDVRQYAKVEPIVLTIYEPGVELVVSSVRIDRDRLRLFFTDPRAPESTPATSLTIQWPTPFSRGFSERQAIDTILRQYIQSHGS
jgi:hypothetical protein